VVAPLAALVLPVAAVVLYFNSLPGPFLFDDGGAIVNELNRPKLAPLSRLWRVPPDSSFAGRPVVALTIAVNDWLGGADVRGYRAVNIAIHALCGLALFGVVRRTLMGPRLGARYGAAADGLALAAALVWLVHPVQSECVGYVSQRTESLMALFYLLTLYCAVRAHDGRRAGVWGLAAVVACALGMASKEVMVTAPVMVVFHDAVYAGQRWGALLRRRWRLYVGLAATWGVLAWMMWAAPRSETVGFGGGVSAWVYALNQCVMLLEYLRITFWPSALVFDYGVPQALTLGEVWPEAAAVLLALAVCAVVVWRWPAVGYPLAWFFIVLGPTSSVVPIVTEVGAERRVYLAGMGLFALAVVLGYAVLTRFGGRRGRVVAMGLAGLWVAGLAAATVQRNREYRSAVAIWTTVVERLPTNARGHSNLAMALMQAGQLEEADAAIVRSLELVPKDVDTLLARGDIYVARRRLYEAIDVFEECLRIEPTLAVAHVKIARVLMAQRQVERAIRRYEQALALKPDYAQAHLELGDALLSDGQGMEAVTHYRAALAHHADWWAPISRLAWVLATHPDERVRDGAEALRLAKRAAVPSMKGRPLVDATLAAAHARVGEFTEAVALAESALRLAEAEGNARVAGEIREQLACYRAGRAYETRAGMAGAAE